MDVTPNQKMFESIMRFTDATVGSAPEEGDKSKAANERRENREVVIAFLHRFAALSMREGVGRWLTEQRKLAATRVVQRKIVVPGARGTA